MGSLLPGVTASLSPPPAGIFAPTPPLSTLQCVTAKQVATVACDQDWVTQHRGPLHLGVGVAKEKEHSAVGADGTLCSCRGDLARGVSAVGFGTLGPAGPSWQLTQGSQPARAPVF